MNMRKLIFTFLLISSSFLLNAQTTVFSEDFENPPGGVTSSGSPGWFINSRLQVSGVNSDSATIDVPNSISYLETTPFDCSGQFFVQLTFKSICKIEFFDNGTIEYSIDGGLTWEQLRDDQGGANNNCTYLGSGLFRTQGSRFEEASYALWQPGQPVSPDNSWWQTEVFDISQVAANNSDVRLRFKNADGNNTGGNNRAGWFVDDIEVIASLCELIEPNLIGLSPFYPPTVYNLGPFTINASATDISGIALLNINYTINGVVQNPIPMVNTVDSLFQGIIPAVNALDTICYYIDAYDGSFCNNVAYYPGPDPSTTVCFIVEEGITFPYCDNFDIAIGLWTSKTLTPGTEWELGTPNYGATNSPHSAPNAWDINLNAPYTNSATAYLQSPEFSFIPTGAGATLEFWQNRNAEGGWDGVRIEWTSVDTINGPWNVLGTVGCVDCVNWYTDPDLNSSNLPGFSIPRISKTKPPPFLVSSFG